MTMLDSETINVLNALEALEATGPVWRVTLEVSEKGDFSDSVRYGTQFAPEFTINPSEMGAIIANTIHQHEGFTLPPQTLAKEPTA
ncbi:MAG: hypothetical protein K0Q52_198 [Microbacterium sp.]|jgi:hypothetical protein|nr:hypothetical protein [Microbacterium sp.]